MGIQSSPLLWLHEAVLVLTMGIQSSLLLWPQLSDVAAGGKTVFPEAGVAVPPVKGAAVFWFNIKKNGYFNKRTLHGGCPVLLGQKWGEVVVLCNPVAVYCIS